jgi:Flp pilus assembly protein TadD
MADYKLLLEGDPSLEGTAWEQLTQLGDSIENDKEALDARGNMSAERGDLHGAEQAFRRALALDPTDLTALSNLGILLARQGDLAQAMQLLNRAFDNNNDIAGLAMNLARIECAAGDGAAARETLQTALVYGPALEDVRRLQEQIKAQTSSCAANGNKQE